MDILEEFKKKADRHRQDQEVSEEDQSGLHSIRNMQVVTALQTIHNYIHELIEQLNFLESETRNNIHIDGVGDLEELRQQEYRLVNESSANKESICLLFAQANDTILETNVDDTIEASKQIDLLKERGLLINNLSKSPRRITIQGYVPVRIEFESDFQDSSIHVTIENFSRLAKEHYILNTENINDRMLDDLGNFILRRNNNFKDLLVEDSQGINPIQRRNKMNSDDTITHTEEMDVSRLRSIFNREHRLYLTYHNIIKDLGARTQGCILGRAKDCELPVKSDLASRHHAKIVYRKGKFVLIDHSTNGTFIKPQGGKEVYVQAEETPLSGSGFISLGKAVTVDNEHLIYYSCQ